MNEALVDSMPFAQSLGITLTNADASAVEGTMLVREDLCTIGNSVHGGALVAFADSLGAIAAFLNLPEGATGTTTVESKTNFLRPAPAGSTITARTEPANTGRRLCVLRTRITSEEGKLIAEVTQTHMVL